MKGFNFEQSQRESKEHNIQWKRMEEEEIRDILQYFDRIRAYLSNYNTLLIGAFFVLVQFHNTISTWTILIPIINSWFLTYINYRVIEKSIFEVAIQYQPFNLIRKRDRKLSATNLLSLLSIITTFNNHYFFSNDKFFILFVSQSTITTLIWNT